jgi:hypothetical protein
MNSHTLRMRECLVKLEYEKKMAELELEDYTTQHYTPCDSSPPLDEYSRDIRQHRIDAIVLKIRKCDIEIRFLLTKLSIPLY